MKKYFSILLVFTLTATNLFSQSIDSEKKINSSSSIFIEYALLEVEFYKNGEGEMKNKNVNSTIFGLSQYFILQNNLDGIVSVGLSEGFEYNFITTNLGFKLSDNFTLSLGGGVYQINDDKWVPTGLDGNEPSNIEFGMNFGINLMLNDNLRVSMKYNLIEPKEEDSVSMSLNGLSFGLVLR